MRTIISQAVILRKEEILMVRQYVQRGDIVWNFPGGRIEDYESPEQACVREVKEETGYDVNVVRLLSHQGHKYSFLAEITSGTLHTDKENPDNEDILEAGWISLHDDEKFDSFTRPLLDMVLHHVHDGQEFESPSQGNSSIRKK